MLPTAVRNGIPRGIQDYDGFDTPTIDTNRWGTVYESTTMSVDQVEGNLVFSCSDAGAIGISYLKSARKFGKIWRISTDMFIDTITGNFAEAYIMLYKDNDNYVKLGPYKSATIDCNCLLRYKIEGEDEHVVELTGDNIDTTYQSTYTIAVINDTLLFYYKGIFITSVPFADLVNYYIYLAAGSATSGGALSIKMDDFEINNSFDTLLMTTGKITRDIRTYIDEIIDDISGIESDIASMASSLAGLKVEPVTNNISGTITLTNTTEQYVTLQTATHGAKFKVNMFADLEGAEIDYCYLYKSTGPVWTDQCAVANTLQSNSILLKPASGGAVGDIIYFGNAVNFKRLDVYMEGGTSNTNNVFEWEGYVGSAWVSLTETDGTLHNSKVFGKSGKVTWTETLAQTAINGITAYWVRARITTLGASLPKASHVQVTEDGATGFDSLAEFMSSLIVSIYRKRGDGNYAELPADIAMPFTQCILYRNIEIADMPAWTDIKIGFKLSVAPTTSISIPYTGYTETVNAT
jgi:hypothetical protein